MEGERPRDGLDAFQRMGVQVVGPAGSVSDTMTLFEADQEPLDRAVLDIHPGEERVYPSRTPCSTEASRSSSSPA